MSHKFLQNNLENVQIFLKDNSNGKPKVTSEIYFDYVIH
jgi:hypothetical protein